MRIEWLTPAALWLLPLLAVLVFLARRAPQRPRHVVSSLHLWSASPASAHEQLSHRPRRRDWTVLLQAAFMLAVIAALARPVIPPQSRRESASPANRAPASDAAPAIAASPRTLRVRLTNPPDNLFVERALAANRALTLVTDGGSADVEVCEGCTTAPPGALPVLLIPAATGNNAPLPLLVRLRDHPLVEGVDSVAATPAVASIAVEGADVIARAGATPVIMARQEHGRRIVTLNADLRDPGFPLTTAFPVLIANAMEWLGTKDVPPPAPGAALAAAAIAPVEIAPWLLAAALAILAIEWRMAARRRRGVHGWRHAMAACLLMAIAGLQVPFGTARTAVVFVLDRSSSLPLRVQRAGMQQIKAMSAAMHDGDLLGLVTFGADASLDLRPTTRRNVPEQVSRVEESGTNLEAALALAQSTLNVDATRRVVLLTDGNETSGDAARQAAVAAASRTRIDVVALDATAKAVVPVVEAVRAPDDVRAGEPFRIGVDLIGRPRSQASVVVTVDGGPRVEREVIFDDLGYASAEFVERQVTSGTFVYRALLPTTDGDEAAGGAVVNVTGPPQVLYVAAASPAISRVLSTAGFTVTRVGGADVPIDDEALARFDSVVLDDVPAASLNAPQMSALSRYIEQHGGGMLLLGAARTLDSAGYPQSVLGPMLPIDVSPRSGRRAPAMAFVLVFDKSGSMGDRSNGVTKIELARESALRVASLLPAGDSLGIIAFDAQPHVVAPLDIAGRDGIGAALRAIEAGGPTSMGPAVEMAVAWMRGSSATRKHVLLITDGRTSDADAARLRRAALAGGFELSVIAIGSDADRALLEAVAAASGGRAYFPDTVRQLPAIVARDAAVASGGSFVSDTFQPRAPHPHPVLAGISATSLPQLHGYVVGSSRTGAETILASPLDDPVLAAWKVGLGRVAMTTTDLRVGFEPLLTQATRWLNRQAGNDVLRVRTTETDDGIDVQVAVDPAIRRPAVDSLLITVRTPSGNTLELTARMVAPGRYQSHAVTSEVGAYQIAVNGTAASSNTEARVVRGFFRSGERERARTGVNHSRLAQIAAITGGRELGAGDSPYRDPRPFSWVSLRPAGALLALALLLIHLTVSTAWWHSRRRQADPVREAA